MAATSAALGGGGAGFTSPAYSKANSSASGIQRDWPGHLRWWWGGEGREGGQEGERKGGGEVAVEEWHHLPWNVTIISSLSLAVYRGDIILSLPLPPPFLVYVAEGGCLFVCTRAGVRVWERVCAWEHFFKGGMSGCLSALSLPLSCL